MAKSTSVKHERVLILILIGGSFVTLFAVWWYYVRQREELHRTTLIELAAIAEFKGSQIATWRRERIGDGRILSSFPIQSLAKAALASSTAPDRAHLSDLMRRMATEFRYADVSLVRPDGSMVLRLNEGAPEESRLSKSLRRRLAEEAQKANDVVLSDLNTDSRNGIPLMLLTAPTSAGGALILEIDPATFLYPYLESTNGLGDSGEVLLVRRERDNQITYLSRRRHGRDAGAFAHRSIVGTQLPSDDVLDRGWNTKIVDYRGVPVIGSVRRIPNSPWFLVVKKDEAEVSAAIQRLAWELGLLAFMISLGMISGVVLIVREQRTSELRERERYLKAVANDTPALLWMGGGGKDTLFANETLARFLGADRENASKDWIDYVHAEDIDRVRTGFRSCVDARGQYEDTFRLYGADGSVRWMRNEARPRFSPAGESAGYAGSLFDITDQKAAEEQLRSANENLERELSERIRKEDEVRRLSARLITAQEEERKRVARELHDDLSQQIAALSIGMGKLKRRITASDQTIWEDGDRIHEKLLSLADSIRRLSHELHPSILQYSGVVAALRDYCREFEKLKGIPVRLEIGGSFSDLPAPIALCVYRVTQEALHNVAKHAKTDAAYVTLSMAGASLHLTIADHGVGIPQTGGTAGLGIVSIAERVRLVNGSIRIDSTRNVGTVVDVQIPIPSALKTYRTSEGISA